MKDPSTLTGLELFWLGSLVLLILGCLGWAARSRDPRAWLQPPLVMSLILFYYSVAGPLNIIHQRTWVDRLTDLRSAMVFSWAGASLSFLAFLIGYGVLHQRLRPPRFSFPFQARLANDLGQRLNAIGLTLFSLSTGWKVSLAYLNPAGVSAANLDFSGGLNLGAFGNYAVLSLNLMVPGCLLMAAAWIKRRNSPIPLAIWIMIAVTIFTSIGFRWRIAVLAGSLLMLWMLARRVRPKAVVMIPTIFGLVFMAGLVELTRSYGQGLKLEYLRDRSLLDILLAGFNESSVFLTSGGLIELTPKQIPYAGLTPLINTLTFPIPNALFPAKDSAGYIFNATATIYGNTTYAKGSVLLNYAEYYLMGGWTTVILMSILLGWIYRRLWLWYSYRSQEPLSQTIYVVNAAFLYVVVSRGYMPQVVMLWAFTAAPLFWLYYYCQRQELRNLRRFFPRTAKNLLPARLRPVKRLKSSHQRRSIRIQPRRVPTL